VSIGRPKRKRWAFLAYIAGDNDLSDNGLADISELCEVGSSDQVHAAVQIDTQGEHDGSIRYEISGKDFENEAHRIVIQRLAESNTGDPKVLRNFLAWGLKRYPADKTLVVIWGHGSGFRSVRRDVAVDDFGTSLNLPQISAAFAGAGVTGRKKIALLGFDACLMNMIEIAHHLAPQVEVLVGSQQTEPGNGWPYDKVLATMLQDPTPPALGKAIVKEYMKSYQRAHEPDVTHSAIDLSQVDRAMAALSRLGKALVPCVASQRNAIRAARDDTQSFEDAPDYLDLIHFCSLIGAKIPKVRPQAEALKSAVKQSLLAGSSYGTGVQHANGLSFWFPTSPQKYAEFRPKYRNLRMGSTQSGWVNLLDAFY